MELLVEASIEGGNVPGDLASRIRRLAELGEGMGCGVMVARAERGLGRLAVVAGDARAAVSYMERALSAFGRLGMPLETQRTRLLLDAALAAEAREVATAEAKQALAGFEQLGAARDADAAAAFLRSLGVNAARTGSRGRGLLTKREREVLELLGEGLCNPEIAARLVVTRKTLSITSRACFQISTCAAAGEAAAYAVRELGRERDSATK